ncbi:hypothetical protein BRD12_00715 [Halobacteriales archaeon SW_12_67_38]|nr:MAG: hypothetical protein BRD12_00715 [Halobacteriales archaeon SW_12_67_38]
MIAVTSASVRSLAPSAEPTFSTSSSESPLSDNESAMADSLSVRSPPSVVVVSVPVPVVVSVVPVSVSFAVSVVSVSDSVVVSVVSVSLVVPVVSVPVSAVVSLGVVVVSVSVGVCVAVVVSVAVVPVVSVVVVWPPTVRDAPSVPVTSYTSPAASLISVTSSERPLDPASEPWTVTVAIVTPSGSSDSAFPK